MKKSLLLAALLVGAAATASAQITLTAATHMPNASRGYYKAFDDTSANPVLPAIGANQTWDYSGVIPVGMDTVAYFNCTPQADCASFSNANLLLGSPNDSFYQYLKTSGNILQTTGVSSPAFTVKLSNPLDLYRYPLTYNTQFTDVSSGTATTPVIPLPLTVTGSDTVKGVGYGTLKTPAGTFSNVLLVRTIINVRVAALFGTLLESRDEKYEWFEAGSRFPVMTYSYNVTVDTSGSAGDAVYSGAYRVTGPTHVQNVGAADAFRLAPNPATGVTRLEIPAEFGSDATILITDISGKKVLQKTAGSQSVIDIHTADWTKGIYLVRVQSASGEALVQKLSVQ